MDDIPVIQAPPDCTLPTAEQPLRIAEFDNLLQRIATSVDRVSPEKIRVNFAGDPDVNSVVANLAARESQCCSFFTFELATSSGESRLDISVPEQRVDVLDALAGRATQVT